MDKGRNICSKSTSMQNGISFFFIRTSLFHEFSLHWLACPFVALSVGQHFGDLSLTCVQDIRAFCHDKADSTGREGCGSEKGFKRNCFTEFKKKNLFFKKATPYLCLLSWGCQISLPTMLCTVSRTSKTSQGLILGWKAWKAGQCSVSQSRWMAYSCHCCWKCLILVPDVFFSGLHPLRKLILWQLAAASMLFPVIFFSGNFKSVSTEDFSMPTKHCHHHQKEMFHHK